MKNNESTIVLSEQKIQSLFDFVKVHHVEQVDVQHELVDHLASAIEDEMTEDASLTFDKALTKVHGRFPVTGFYHFVAQKQKALHKYWDTKLLKMMSSYYRLPNIILTIAIFIGAYASIYNFGQAGFIGLFVLGAILLFWADHRTNKYIDTVTDNSSFLVVSAFKKGIRFSESSGWVVAVAMLLMDYGENLSSENYIKIGIASLIIKWYFIWAHAIMTYFPIALVNELKVKYRHLKLNIA